MIQQAQEKLFHWLNFFFNDCLSVISVNLLYVYYHHMLYRSTFVMLFNYFILFLILLFSLFSFLFFTMNAISWTFERTIRGYKILDHLTSPGLAYSQILLARIYEPLVLVNTVISGIRLADLNPCTTCTMYRVY